MINHSDVEILADVADVVVEMNTVAKKAEEEHEDDG